MELLDYIEAFILTILQTLYDTWGWLGVAILLIFENATGITPSEVILGLAGWMLIAEHQLPPTTIFLGGFYAAISSAVGASITYWIARLGGRPMVEKFARWVRIKPAHIARAEALFNRWGIGLVLFGRLIPGIRTLVNIPAGLARMPFLTFFITTLLGAYAWCTLLIGAGYLLGQEWALVSKYLKLAFPYLLGSGIIALILYYWITHRPLSPAQERKASDDD